MSYILKIIIIVNTGYRYQLESATKITDKTNANLLLRP